MRLSAQENSHHLLVIKLLSSTFKVFNVNLHRSCCIKLTQESENGFVTDDSILDMYAQREKFLVTHSMIMDSNLVDFVTKYNDNGQ